MRSASLFLVHYFISWITGRDVSTTKDPENVTNTDDTISRAGQNGFNTSHDLVSISFVETLAMINGTHDVAVTLCAVLMMKTFLLLILWEDKHIYFYWIALDFLLKQFWHFGQDLNGFRHGLQFRFC